MGMALENREVMNNANAPILKLDKVTKIYHTRGNILGRGKSEVVALNQVSLQMNPGEIFGLVGESGSGKTTAGRLIVGLEKANSGKIFLEGHEIANLKGKALKLYRRQVQMVFQDPYQSFNPQVSIMDSVGEPLLTQGLAKGEDREERVLAALKVAGLSPPESYAYRFPHQLSGGQRQRVAIARAMILEPSVLVADEPTSMLDASYSAQIFDLLLGVRKHLGSTILFITHSLASARYLCDRVAVIYRGNLMELGPASEVINNPKHPYTQALLDATPKFGRCGDIPRFGTLLAAERPPAAPGVGCGFFWRCKPAQRSLCAVKTPEWRQVGDDHVCACHFAQPGTPDAAPGQECRLGV
jgi:oligopeptide/dipeptide ABC transporter ATP-binding protein